MTFKPTAADGRRLRERPAKPTTPPETTPPRIVGPVQKALESQRLLDAGEVKTRAELARQECVTRARVTQLMNLLELAPEIQEAIPYKVIVRR